jgi:signal transduction histidine kinase
MDQFDTGEQSAEALGFAEVLKDCLVHGVLVIDSRHRIVALNEEAGKLIGLDTSSLQGRGEEVLPEPFKELIHDTFTTQTTVAARKVTVSSQASPPRALRISSTFCPGLGGALSQAIILVHDLAAEHKLGGNMQRLDRLASIGTVSASMAHEIKNALVAVNTFVEDLLLRNKDSELAGLVTRELRRIDSIVSQMLKFAGPSKPTFSPSSLHRILDQSLRLVQPQLEAKQIRLRRSFTAPWDRLEGDDYQLEQAFVNLFMNAVAAMDPQGQLSVSTALASPDPTENLPADDTAPEPLLDVTIQDTGAGIAPENLSRLFEPFFTTKPHGTGLGLAITRRIVLEHRGKISVSSELKKGTTFQLLFPLLPARS